MVHDRSGIQNTAGQKLTQTFHNKETNHIKFHHNFIKIKYLAICACYATCLHGIYLYQITI